MKRADAGMTSTVLCRRPAYSRCVAALLLCVPLSAAGGEAPATRPARIQPVPRTPEYTSTGRPTEEMLGRDTRVIVLPSEPGEFGDDRTQRSGGAIARLPSEMRRLPEGYVIAAREGRFERQGLWLVAHLSAVRDLPDAPPMRILPNPRLGILEAILADKTDQPTFLVTGRVTEFQGNNYLLIEDIRAPREKPRPPERVTPPEPTVPSPAPVTQTAPAREPTAEEIVRQLMEVKPRRAIVIPDEEPVATRPSDAPGAPPAQRDAAAFSDESHLADRTARIVPGEPWWMLAFDDPGAAKDRPLRLLPNQALETAIALTGGGTRNVVLIVSGEITSFKGINYVLLRKVLVRRDMGNFR